MSAHEDARDEIRHDLASLTEEISVVRTELVLPGWGGVLHGYSRTLYGYVMNCFAFVDLLSTYWSRTHLIRGRQTQLMTAFMRDRVGYEQLASAVAVHMWRHKLMHTARPPALLGARTGRQYRWLLHWGADHLPRDQHMVFQEIPGDWILNIGLEFLVDDLRSGADRYLQEVENTPSLQVILAAANHGVVEPQIFDD